jgi:hypothetical protein
MEILYDDKHTYMLAGVAMNIESLRGSSKRDGGLCREKYIQGTYLPQTKDSIMKQLSKKSHAPLPPSARGMTACSRPSLSACSPSVGSKTDNSIR